MGNVFRRFGVLSVALVLCGACSGAPEDEPDGDGLEGPYSGAKDAPGVTTPPNTNPAPANTTPSTTPQNTETPAVGTNTPLVPGATPPATPPVTPPPVVTPPVTPTPVEPTPVEPTPVEPPPVAARTSSLPALRAVQHVGRAQSHAAGHGHQSSRRGAHASRPAAAWQQSVGPRPAAVCTAALDRSGPAAGVPVLARATTSPRRLRTALPQDTILLVPAAVPRRQHRTRSSPGNRTTTHLLSARADGPTARRDHGHDLPSGRVG